MTKQDFDKLIVEEKSSIKIIFGSNREEIKLKVKSLKEVDNGFIIMSDEGKKYHTKSIMSLEPLVN